MTHTSQKSCKWI